MVQKVQLTKKDILCFDPFLRLHAVNYVVGLVLDVMFFATEVQVYIVQCVEHGTCT